MNGGACPFGYSQQELSVAMWCGSLIAPSGLVALMAQGHSGNDGNNKNTQPTFTRCLWCVGGRDEVVIKNQTWALDSWSLCSSGKINHHIVTQVHVKMLITTGGTKGRPVAP